nr:zinc finger, CCHC-type [Tanacetum cinerariifolium]
MARPLFNRIVTALNNYDPFLHNNIDSTRREEISPLIKCTSAIRQLAYGVNEKHGFSWMLGSLNCTDWEWFGCPYAFKEQYFRRDHGSNPFILLKAAALQDLWIWHAFFGVAGLNNDVNVLYQSSLFNDLKTDRAPEIPFVANGVSYPSRYYLVDEIYPELAPLVKTIPEPPDNDHKRILYKQKQESARKNVERVFGVLKKKWAVLANHTRAQNFFNMMYTCIILHNMIHKYKKVAISPKWFPEEAHQPEDLLRNEEQIERVMRSNEDNFIILLVNGSLSFGEQNFVVGITQLTDADQVMFQTIRISNHDGQWIPPEWTRDSIHVLFADVGEIAHGYVARKVTKAGGRPGLHDPYDDDMYEGRDLSHELQAICDNLDIRLRDNVLYVPGIRKNLVSEIVLNKCGYKQVLENDKYILSRHGSFVGFGYVCNGHVHYKRMRDMSKISLIAAFDMTHESCKTCMLTKITRQPFKGVNWESKVLDLIHSDLCDFHANPSLGHNKYVITFIDDASRYCYVYLSHAKHEALDKFKIYKQKVELQRQDLIKVLRTDRGGEYYDPVYFQSTGIIYQTTAPYIPQQNGVAERKNRTLKEMVNSMLSYSGLKPNDYVSVNSIIESRDDIFDEERFTSIPRPRGMIQPSSGKIAKDEVEGTDDVPGSPVPRKSTRTRKAKSFGSDFQLYLVEGTRDKTLSQREYCFIIEEDPRTLSEPMASRDVAFWKEAVQSELDSFMHNDTWELTDLPPGCKALGSLAVIHDLVIHQMDVKITFLNGDLDEEIYMKQPEGFVMPGHESKVCKLKKSLYGLKQASKQWHQKFDDVVLSNGFSLNQADKCVYSKFDASGKGVIICLYANDMLIFGTDQDQVNKTKEFLSSKFDMKDLEEAEVILGIKIKRGNNGVSISQSHYIEKILTKFNFSNCSPIYTPVDLTVKFQHNKGTPVSQLEYSRAIGCLMYAMISTRPDIAFAVGKLSRYTSNPSALHWQALGRVFQYLKKTMNYGLTYSGYPSVIEGYSDASWINNMEDHSSTSGWVFLLEGAGNEAEWLRNLVYEIPLWPKLISTISIRCDSAATLAKAYSQVYNGKSRHLGVRHSMIRELIMNGVISVEFVKTQLNLADHLTKGLARDLVREAAIGMGLKST